MTEAATFTTQGESASGRAILSLVLGIGAFVVCMLLAPFAWLVGNVELADIRAGRASAGGESIARAGQILGIIGTALIGLTVLALALVGMLVLAAVALIAILAA